MIDNGQLVALGLNGGSLAMKIRFDGFEFDVPCHELRRAGRELSVQPLILDLLLYLIRWRERVVTREELLREVWQGTVVSPAAVNQAVAVLRRTLRDDGSRQKLIRTVHRHGYRFVAAVRCEQ